MPKKQSKKGGGGGGGGDDDLDAILAEFGTVPAPARAKGGAPAAASGAAAAAAAPAAPADAPAGAPAAAAAAAAPSAPAAPATPASDGAAGAGKAEGAAEEAKKDGKRAKKKAKDKAEAAAGAKKEGEDAAGEGKKGGAKKPAPAKAKTGAIARLKAELEARKAEEERLRQLAEEEERRAKEEEQRLAEEEAKRKAEEEERERKRAEDREKRRREGKVSEKELARRKMEQERLLLGGAIIPGLMQQHEEGGGGADGGGADGKKRDKPRDKSNKPKPVDNRKKNETERTMALIKQRQEEEEKKKVEEAQRRKEETHMRRLEELLRTRAIDDETEESLADLLGEGWAASLPPAPNVEQGDGAEEEDEDEEQKATGAGGGSGGGGDDDEEEEFGGGSFARTAVSAKSTSTASARAPAGPPVAVADSWDDDLPATPAPAPAAAPAAPAAKKMFNAERRKQAAEELRAAKQQWEAQRKALVLSKADEQLASLRAKMEQRKVELQKQREEEERKEKLRKEEEAKTRDILTANERKENKGRELRSPICVILGHVDTGKTKLLDKIRATNVQEGEAGGITQQIGATYFPMSAIQKFTEPLESWLEKKRGSRLEYLLPGLLVIDTPGHESFTNLRARGSNLCDIAILVVDVMHGLEPQTLESLKLLRDRNTPFVVALNKIDRMYGWKAKPWAHAQETLALQEEYARKEFEQRAAETVAQLGKQGLDSCLYYDNADFGRTLSLVPTSAITGEGVPDLLHLIIELTQTRMSRSLVYTSELQCTVLEVKVIDGLGHTLDVVLVNGVLRENDTIVVCGLAGPIVTSIRALLTPQPLKELRVKGEYIHHKSVRAAMGVKIWAPGLEQAIPGSALYVVNGSKPEEVEEAKNNVMEDLQTILSRVDKSGRGVYVQASTLGSLEALLKFLEDSKIPVSGISIGPVHKKDVMRAATMTTVQKEFATILAFDVRVTPEAEDTAKEQGVRIFTADIIYHLFDQFTAYMQQVSVGFGCARAMIAGRLGRGGGRG
jgi:translation initiation factor 5B